MNRYKNFFIKHRIKAIFLLPISLILTFSAMYISSFLKQNTFSYHREVSLNFKTIITNSVIKKYSDLFTREDSDLHSNFDYINQLVKFRAELLQLINGTNINIILYGKDGQMLFDSDLGESHYEQLLTPNELEQLIKNEYLFYNKNNQFLISIFSIATENTEPFLFLKIIHKYHYGPFTQTCFISVAFMLFLLIVMILLIYYLYNKNSNMLNTQYQVNLKLENAKAIAEKENVSKSRFLANVTHELRTPLNSIIGFSEIIKNESAGSMGNTQYKEYIDDIYDSGIHLLSLINDILDLSKAEADKLVVEKVKFDLNQVIESCLHIVTPNLQKAKVNVKKILSEEQLMITADPKRMKQVIINILSNAVKFTPENGIIKLKAEKNTAEKNISIEISDTGIGIVQQDMYKVLSVFGQSNDNSNTQYEGTGLGLPLSKKLVELMGGTFSIKSEPQLGTTLTLVFPIEIQHF